MKTKKANNTVKFTRIKSNKVNDITMGIDAIEAMTSMMDSEFFNTKDEFLSRAFTMEWKRC
ncbi:MAG: hypothetical protein Q9M92_07425 [Enterobacterales bacterium]|nr:hypothetical protein [Enterobacterales bacterium]